MLGGIPEIERAEKRKAEWPFLLFLLVSVSAYLGLLLLILGANVVTLSGSEFVRVLRSPEIQASIKLTLVSCTATAILSVLVAVPTGYLLSRYRFRGKQVVDTLMDIPILLPPLVVGLSLLILFNQVSPSTCFIVLALAFLLVAACCRMAGGGRFVIWLFIFFAVSMSLGAILMWGGKGSLESSLRDWGMPVTFHPLAVVLAQFPVAAAFAIRMMRTTFDQIDPRFEEVAMTLGCRRSQAFTRVVLPMAGKGVLAAGTMAWARAMGEFGPVLIFAGATRGRTEVLSTSVFLEIETGNLAGAAVISLLMILMATGTLLIVRMFVGRGGGQ